MGSLFKTSTPAPTPPAPPSTIRDEINGVEQVPVTNPDGSITYITRAIPLTEEQKAQKDQIDAILKESLGEIQKLSAADYAPDDVTQKILDQWKTTQGDLLKTQVTERTQAEEEELARRGLSDSTAAQSVRRQRSLDQQKAEQGLQTATDDMAEQIRNDKLSLQQNLYNLAASQTDATAARTAQAAAKAQSSALALNTQRQASLLDYYGNGSSFADSFGNSLGSSLGKSAGNTLDEQFNKNGGWIGSLFQ